ncbi:MAG: ATP-binding cassette domain-containing protein [Synechococcaceae cyanobacterium SM2_3_2]|nr:ATP-binding cassette domain-containing protein [Synechococcaceae cyanobacterium SM2_3_2]
MQVELRQISKAFGSVQANTDISLQVEEGSIHALLGENGAGKSTLVKILSGFISCDSGTILLQGQQVKIHTPAEAIRHGIGMVHQDPLDFPSLSVLDNLLVGRPGGIPLSRRAARLQFEDVGQSLGFELRLEDTVEQLTVGERQQLEILRLLSLGVKTLILDEPTTGISESQKQLLFHALKQLVKQGRSVIFVSHKLEDVDVLCDRVTVLRQGQVAGHRSIPCNFGELVEMMFGQVLTVTPKPPTQPGDPLLEIRQSVVADRRLRISIPDLTLQTGEVMGLAGLEGSGQQLMLLMCAGLLKPLTGSLVLRGQDLSQADYSTYGQAGVAYLPANRLREGLIRGLSIRDHVALKRGGRLWSRPAEASQAAQSLIETFRIRGQSLSLVDRLSGGNQQRTQLALLPENLHLLLMEHPTRGLDIDSAQWVWQQLIERCQSGTGILFFSTDLEELLRYSDRILVFSGGQISQPVAAAGLSVADLGHLMGGAF